jgi:hypothetical protein
MLHRGSRLDSVQLIGSNRRKEQDQLIDSNRRKEQGQLIDNSDQYNNAQHSIQ